MQITEGSGRVPPLWREGVFKTAPECLCAVWHHRRRRRFSRGHWGVRRNQDQCWFLWSGMCLCCCSTLCLGKFLPASTSSARQEVARAVLDMMTHPSTHMLFQPAIWMARSCSLSFLLSKRVSAPVFCLLHPGDLHVHQKYFGEQCGDFGEAFSAHIVVAYV